MILMPGAGESRIMGPDFMGPKGFPAGLDKTGGRPGPQRQRSKRRSLKLEALYERHGESLYRYLVFRLGSAEDAEDVLQEAFVRFARYDLRWRLVRNETAFVFRVARNESNRFLRRRLGRKEGERMIASGRAGRFSEAFVTPVEPTLALLLRRAAELPAEQREAVYLKVFDGLTFKEIASVCDVSVNTAASRYRYGIEKLRGAVGGGS
jgi:RNA polymerase sigma-70 factor (ECF subfamily)